VGEFSEVQWVSSVADVREAQWVSSVAEVREVQRVSSVACPSFSALILLVEHCVTYP